MSSFIVEMFPYEIIIPTEAEYNTSFEMLRSTYVDEDLESASVPLTSVLQDFAANL